MTGKLVKLGWVTAFVLALTATSPALATNRQGAVPTAAQRSATPTPAPAGSTIRLVSQSGWVDAHDPVFDLQVRVSGATPPEQFTVVVDVLTRVATRSELDRSFADGYQSYFQQGGVVSSPLPALNPDASGAVDMRIPVSSLRLFRSGVYPVSVELRSRSATVARMVTHILYRTDPVRGERLAVAWIVPIHSPPTRPGTPRLSREQDARLTTLANALSVHARLPLTLAPTPDTIDALDASDPAVVSRIGRSVVGREILASTWVPTPLPAMLAAGLNDQLSLSLTRGTDTVGSRLGTSITSATWLVDGVVDQDALAFVRGARFDRVVLPEADLDPVPFKFTLAQPFEVAGRDRTQLRAAAADSGLAAHFNDQADQVLAAHQLLADLDQIYEDAPASRRGVVLATPRTWSIDGAFLDAFMTGLETAPVLSGVTVAQYFAAVPPVLERGQPLERNLVVNEEAVRAVANGLLASDQRSTRDQLEALASALPPDTPVYPLLDRVLLDVSSSDLSPPDRRQRLDAVAAGIRAETRLVQLPPARTITLTERKGRLPVVIVSQSDEPIRVLLRVDSDKLRFPLAGTARSATFTEDLKKGRNLVDLLVEARTSGAFPLHITVLSPKGGLVIQQTTFTVQSTALSGVGVILSGGAAAFLTLWWGRHAWRARKRTARRHSRHRPDPVRAP